jgi:hypothetical protein
MSMHRQLVSVSALGMFVFLAFGSEAPEDTGSGRSVSTPEANEPSSEPSDGAAAPAAAGGGEVSCSPWTGTGNPASSIEELFDANKLATLGRKLDLNVDCYDIEEYDGDKELDCNFWNARWDFDVEITKFRSSQDAGWEVEDPWVGEAYLRQGNWVLGVDASNGTCAKAMLDSIVPPGQPVKGMTEQRVIDAIKAAGWRLGEYGCSVEKYDGERSIDCPALKGKELEASISLSYEIEGGDRLDEERELDSGHAYLRQAYAYGSCGIDDSVSARNMLKALVK